MIIKFLINQNFLKNKNNRETHKIFNFFFYLSLLAKSHDNSLFKKN